MQQAIPSGNVQALPRRGSTLALGLLSALVLACGAVLAHLAWAQWHAAQRTDPTVAMVQALQLTDFAWFTEARYTRHLSQADGHSAFQDGPAAMEHFPAGSLVMPSRTLPTSGFSDPTTLR
jgi:hypothetical protein